MNRVHRLYDNAELTVDLFDHPPHETHEDPDLEVGSRWAIAFVEAGHFDIAVDRDARRLETGGVFLTRPGLEFRCRHDHDCPDDVCVSVGFSPEAVAEHEHAWTRAGWVTRAAPPPRLSYAHRRLGSAARAKDAFEMERWALETFAALASDAKDERARGPYRARPGDLDAVVSVAGAIEADPVARMSVAERSRDVGMTSTRLTHAFRRYAGTSPHQYVVRWRLAVAASLLDDGASVSDACYRAGFENLSHFCRTYLRQLGERPSRWNRLGLAERRRKVQDLLRPGA